jgi:hypothetical protein
MGTAGRGGHDVIAGWPEFTATPPGFGRFATAAPEMDFGRARPQLIATVTLLVPMAMW